MRIFQRFVNVQCDFVKRTLHTQYVQLINIMPEVATRLATTLRLDYTRHHFHMSKALESISVNITRHSSVH